MEVFAITLVAGVSVAELALHLAMRVWLGEAGYDRLHLWVKESIGVGLVLLAAALYNWQYRPTGDELLTTMTLMFVGSGALLGLSHLIRWGRKQRTQGAAGVIEDMRR